jgi:hypothetical protein
MKIITDLPEGSFYTKGVAIMTVSKDIKISNLLLQAVAACKVVRRPGSHISCKIGLRMVVMFQPYAPAALYLPGRFVVLISVRDSTGYIAAGRFREIEKSNDLVENRNGYP